MTQIALPWPPAELSPNKRAHHQVKARAVKAYRSACYWSARPEKLAMPEDGEVVLSLVFHPPDAHRRDLDNMLAAAKAGLDGFADAHAIDDNRFALLLRRGAPTKGGKILVSLASQGGAA